MNDRLELAAAGLASLYLFVAISVADLLLLAPSVAALGLAACARLRGALPAERGYDRR